MTCLTVRWAPVDTGVQSLKNIPDRIDQVAASIGEIRGSLSFSNTSSYEMRQRLLWICDALEHQSSVLRSMAQALSQARSRYASCEDKLAADMAARKDISDAVVAIRTFMERLDFRPGEAASDDFSLNDLFLGLMGEEGFVGKTAAAWLNLSDEDKSALEKGLGLGKSGAGLVGVMASWMKNGMDESEIAQYLFGWNTKNIPEGMDFWKALKGEAGDYLLENGDDMTKAARVGNGLSVGAKWIGGVLSLAGSAVDNYEEYKSGEISGGRAVAETLTETAVDVGSDMLIGAGITAGAAALGITAAPALVVGGIGVAAKWGLDCLCESLWDKNFSETVSDGLLDMASGVGDFAQDMVSGVSDFAEDMASNAGKVCDAIGDSVGKVATGVTGGLKSIWKSATSWAFG